MTNGSKAHLRGLFYPNVSFDSLFIPHIYKEIYIDHIYDSLKGKKDLVIVDVGANIGLVTDFFRHFAKKLYAVEPSVQHFAALKKNKEFNHWDNVEVFNLAIADRDGLMTLYQNPTNRTCFSLIEDHGHGGEQVATICLDSFFKQNNIHKVDFMKLDVEKAEGMILRSPGFINVAKRIRSLEIEFHTPHWQGLSTHLTALGFTRHQPSRLANIIVFSRD